MCVLVEVGEPMIRMTVFPGAPVRGKCSERFGEGEVPARRSLSRPSLSRCARSASREQSASTTKNAGRPSLGWTVGIPTVVTRVPPARTSAVSGRESHRRARSRWDLPGRPRGGTDVLWVNPAPWRSRHAPSAGAVRRLSHRQRQCLGVRLGGRTPIRWRSAAPDFA